MSYAEFEAALEHHGILGQKWGIMHGPPYPLDSSVSTGSKLKATAAGAIKKLRNTKQRFTTLSKEQKYKALRKKDLKTIIKHIDEFSNDELNAIKYRIILENDVRKLSRSKTEKMFNDLDKLNKWTDTSIKSWNNFARIYNAAFDPEVPLRQVAGGGKNKSSRRNDDDD